MNKRFYGNIKKRKLLKKTKMDIFVVDGVIPQLPLREEQYVLKNVHTNLKLEPLVII